MGYSELFAQSFGILIIKFTISFYRESILVVDIEIVGMIGIIVERNHSVKE